MSHLTDSQVAIQLEELAGWEQQDNAIVKKYQFTDFVQAISFMTEVAFYAEQIKHHPEWSNLYNSVSVKLMTHEVNGITSHDIQLATRMEEIANSKLIKN